MRYIDAAWDGHEIRDCTNWNLVDRLSIPIVTRAPGLVTLTFCTLCKVQTNALKMKVPFSELLFPYIRS